jgi:predicted Fe-S protein YdhL (DUF1289 family)
MSGDGVGGPAPVSPCVAVCIMDPATGFCRGCWRSIGEIAGWLDFSPEEKRRVVADAATRKAEAEKARSTRSGALM